MSNLFYCIQYHIGNPKSAVSLLELHLLHVLFCFFEKPLFKIYALKIGILLPFRGINILFQIISKHKRKYSNLFTILVPFNDLAFDKTLYRLPAERILIVYWDVSVSNPHRSQLSHRHFGKLSDFSRNTIQFHTLRITNQNNSLPNRNQIYYWSTSTHISALHQTYTHALPI